MSHLLMRNCINGTNRASVVQLVQQTVDGGPLDLIDDVLRETRRVLVAVNVLGRVA